MQLREAKELAVKLMVQHGLYDWTFKFDSARNRAGVCKFRPKVIGLSRYLTRAMSDEKVKDTILHEIAHALVGARHGHDRVWQAKAIEIGCDGQRCYDSASEVDRSLMPQSKYTFTCPTCGKETAIHRRPKRRKSCGKCSSRFNPQHELVLTQNY